VKRNKIVSTLGNAVGDAADTVAAKARSVGHKDKNVVEEHPLAAAAIGIGVAAVAGVIGSRLLRKRSKTKETRKTTNPSTKTTKPASKMATRAKAAKNSSSRTATKKS
jgi:Na+/glutamate symporter